ncbi:MAG: response regulator [Paracoccaceae bacterium]
MAERTSWQDELLRQKTRLETDLVSRSAGAILTCVLFAFFLPFWFLFFVYLLIVSSELLLQRELKAFAATPRRRYQITSIAVSAFGMAIYVLPAVVIWVSGDMMLRFVGALSIVGALLNVSVVRATHLPMGVATGIPPALALLWMPLYHIATTDPDASALVSLAAVLALLGYFVAALLNNHRTQADLLAAIADASAASRAKSRFLAAMSHEVRTPLNAILGHTQLMRGHSKANVLNGHLASVESAAQNLERLIGDVIDLAAVAEGELRFNPVTAAIRREIGMLQQIKLPVNGSGALRVAVDIAEDVPEFGRFDPVLLRKCLYHLCALSLGEQPTGSPPRLNIRCTLAPQRDDRIRVTVAGGSPGTEGSDLTPAPQIAAPGQDTLTLSFVHGIAGVMGAKAAALRAPDNTLVTRIEFPFVKVPDPPEAGAEAIYGHLKALVVDDIATNRFVVVQMLRSLRIEAFEAQSGQDALEQLSRREIDLVLLDMNMPDMDGEATFQAIRAANSEWSDLPVIALTADAVTYQRDHYLGLGMNGYLSKPVDRRLLWAEVLSAAPPPPPL